MAVAGCRSDVWGNDNGSYSQSDLFRSRSPLCCKLPRLSNTSIIATQYWLLPPVVQSSCVPLQAEFNMSLPEMGLLQSSALIGYLLGQVSCSLPCSHLAYNGIHSKFLVSSVAVQSHQKRHRL